MDNINFDPSWIRDQAASLGCSAQEVDAAITALQDGTVTGLAVSGKMASGKDTIAPVVLARLGIGSVEHLSFAAALKSEINQLLDIVRSSEFPMVAVLRAAAEMDMPQQWAATLVDLVWGVAGDESIDAYSRTPEIRRALQLIGTEVRRAQDPDYWVKRALGPAIRAMAQGRSVFFTDCRFPNEVTGSQRIGCVAVRLEISPECQAARLGSRDGLAIDPAAAAHPSETSLDDYEGFDAVIDNSGELECALKGTIAAVEAHRDLLMTTPRLA